MKKLLLSIAAACLFLNVRAQSDSAYFEVGMNAIRLVKMGVGDGEIESDKWNPYMFTCNIGIKRISLRFGVGYESALRRELPSFNGVTSDSSFVKSDMRFGLGWEIPLGRKWDLKLGADFVLGRRFTSFETKYIDEADIPVEIKQETDMSERGVSPFIYLEYHVSKNVSIGTEVLWRLTSYKTVETDDSSLNTSTMVRDFEGTKRLLQAPSALFVSVRF